jgi:hypothetical protein
MRALRVLFMSLLAVFAFVAQAVAFTPDAVQYPDLQTVIPASGFSVVQGTDGPEFRYTHMVFSAGPGPFAIMPSYLPTSGNYIGNQELWGQNAAGRWEQLGNRKIPDPFIYHAAHGHFHFPLAAFGLYSVASDGGLGQPVTMSPKNGFCIGDSFMYDNTVTNAGTFPAGSIGSCADPLSLRGMTTGAADEYDYRDPGQAIPMTGVPDGTYWFRAITDPNNDVKEIDESNNETDIKVTIRGATVTPSTVLHPNTTPPALTLDAPSSNATVRGAASPLSATAPAGSIVQFLVDGQIVATSAQTSAPYTATWNTASVVDGEHWLAARTIDSKGYINTSEVADITVDNSPTPPPATGALAIDASVNKDAGGTVTTPAFSTLSQGDTLIALVSSDGPVGQTATVSGAGLTWTMIRRANSSQGSSEIWKAVALGALSSATVTSTQRYSGYHQSLQVLAIANAAGIGGAGNASAASGMPSVSLTSQQAGSWVFGVGNDWDRAVARTLPSDQSIVHQWVDTGVGDTFWSQRVTAPTAAAGSTVTVKDTAPVNDQYNMAAIEVLAGQVVMPPADTNPPRITLTDPPANTTVSGIVQLGATASDDVGVTSVQFKLDGQPLGAPDTAPPFSYQWDSRFATQGAHVLTAEASDAAGNVGVSTSVPVSVDNSAPAPGAITIDKSVNVHAKGTLTAPALTTANAGEQLLAFVAQDGPGGANKQSTTVTGGGLSWTLVKRAASQSGVAEIWTARANTVLNAQVIRATPRATGFDGLLDVIAFNGAAGTQVAGAAGAASGAPDIYLPGIQTGSWVFAVGNDWDSAAARVPASGQVLQHQWQDTRSGDAFWVQSMATPQVAPGLVTIHDNSPTTDQWNYAAVELVAAPVSGTSSTSSFVGSTPVATVARSAAPTTSGIASETQRLRQVIAATALCDLGSIAQLPSAADVRRTVARLSALRRAGRRQAARHAEPKHLKLRHPKVLG